MVAACAAHVPVARLPARVAVIRNGRALSPDPPLFLQRGDEIRVSPPARFTFAYNGNRYRVNHGRVRLTCSRVLLDAGGRPRRPTLLAVRLLSGRVQVRAGGLSRRAGVELQLDVHGEQVGTQDPDVDHLVALTAG